MVRIYTIENCPYCMELKKILTNEGVKFTEIDVNKPENEEEFNKSIQLKVWDRIAFGNWRSYEEAKYFAKKNKIRLGVEWFALAKNRKLPKIMNYGERRRKVLQIA
jgi:glutaredoxin